MTTLPPPTSDLAAWTGQTIESADPRAAAVLRMSSNLVRAYTGQKWDDSTVPDVVADVVVQVAARVWLNPNGVISVTADDGSLRWSDNSAAGLYLTDADKAVLDAYQNAAGSTGSGIGTIGTTRGDLVSDTVYVPTGPPPSGYPFPWYAADGY